jgi:hypothetical protein
VVAALTSMANSGTAGYFAGGNTGSGLTSRIDKLDFSAETITTISATLSIAKEGFAGMADSGVL